MSIAHLMEEAMGGERLVTQRVNLRAGARTQMLSPRLGGLLLLQDSLRFVQGRPISSSPPTAVWGSGGLAAKLCPTLF